jgi:hypothetical protein
MHGNRVGLVELLLHLLELGLELSVFVGQRVRVRLGPALLGREAGEHAEVTLAPPRRQVRRVEALAPEQLADSALHTRRGCFVRLPDDTCLVLSRERPALRTLR